MTEQIELAVGQTWLDDDGIKRTIRLIEKYMVCYCSDEQFLDIDTYQNFLTKYANKLVPKTVRKSQCVVKRQDTNEHHICAELFSSKEEAEKYFEYNIFSIVQWPLVVNGIEQWIEVPSEQ